MGMYLGQPGGSRKHGFWWEAPKEHAHEAISALVDRLREQDTQRREALMRFRRMYGNYGPSTRALDDLMPPDRLRYNLVGQAVDTAQAEICSQRPRIAFVVDGGDWTLSQKLKDREQLIDAQFRANQLHLGLGQQVQRDSGIGGSGFAYVYGCPMSGDVKIERVLQDELLVDAVDAYHGSPRSLHRVRLIDREVLKRKFPKVQLDDQTAPRITLSEFDEWLLPTTFEPNIDATLLIESWHLPSAPEAKDGVYQCATRGALLHRGAYTRQRVPFAKLDWSPATQGYWGTGIAEAITADQIELNLLLMKLQDSMASAAGMWLIPRGSKINKSYINGVPGNFLDYAGTAPTYYAPSTVPNDVFNQIDRIIDRALGRLGLNQQLARAEKPTGLVSGEAQRVHADLGSKRQVTVVQRYEGWHETLAQLCIDANQDLASMGKNGETQALVKRGRREILKRIKWDDSEIDEKRYMIRSYPVSSLPGHPAGRKDTVSEWLQSGLITPEQAKALVDIPDPDGHMKLDLADHDFALWAFESMLEDGTVVHADPHVNLAVVIPLVRKAYVRALVDGAPEGRLELVREFMDRAKELEERVMAAEQAAQAPAEGPVDPTMQGAAPDQMPPDLAALPGGIA